MATFAYKLLAQGVASTSAASIYPTTTQSAIVRMVQAINIGASDTSITFFQNGTASTNKIGKGTTYIPKAASGYDGSVEYDCYWAMGASNYIAAQAGLSGIVVYNLWGVEIT